ncbi:Alpha/Beta hydrolase protein [Leucosporidium creatinivorum]|uniref:Alpha/Beta hydrolase protein n=1 Tax=Leucosporidium creatinivorum TaxID=106004 RepID=A0A1Y2F506_9BASI|nr:Alpha/Beta hydrolase protein [Leucosporidium creatinivorum]
MSQTKLQIPQAGFPTPIVGILQRARPEEGTRGQPVVLIIHGVLAHKDQVYHKKLANRLAEERGWDSFRYDLRGQGGESEGKWGMMNLDDDIVDLKVVIAYLEEEWGYRIHLIIAHSRGSMITAYYLSCFPHPHIPLFVNLSGRYDMTRILTDSRYSALRTEEEEYDKKAVVDWKVKVAGKELSNRVTWEGLRSFAEWNNDYLHHSFPQDIDVLTVHGTADQIVPVQDAYTFHTILSRRSPGTHSLSIVEGATHNYLKPFDEPVDSILKWLRRVDPPSSGVGAGGGGGGVAPSSKSPPKHKM